MEKFLRLRDVLDQTGLSRTTIYRWIKTGDFPRQVKPWSGPNAPSLWVRSEVDAWMQEKIQARDSG
jgi:prophage regulatory protein